MSEEIDRTLTTILKKWIKTRTTIRKLNKKLEDNKKTKPSAGADEWGEEKQQQ